MYFFIVNVKLYVNNNKFVFEIAYSQWSDTDNQTKYEKVSKLVFMLLATKINGQSF